MDGRNIEPRKVMWAVAEISWSDGVGTPNRASATIEDMSLSGACIRVKAPIGIGARLTVKWHREQFSAIARNCRRDGPDFILGLRRDSNASEGPAIPSAGKNVPPEAPKAAAQVRSATKPDPPVVRRPEINLPPAPVEVRESPIPPEKLLSRKASSRLPDPLPEARSGGRNPLPSEGASARQERKAMTNKTFFQQFWRRQQDGDAPDKAIPTEAPVNKTYDSAADGVSGPRNELLSYDDIYHAAGIMSPRSGYGIHKVIEMLSSDRIRDLSKDIQRASVLMALDAAGASVDELLQDANRRQHALNSYEDGQRKQMEEFETRKVQENARIQAEMERITAHYAERIQRNRELVAREKEALRNWQMAKQHETQRISEVIDLCAKPQTAPALRAMTAAAGQSTGDAATGNSRRPAPTEISNRS